MTTVFETFNEHWIAQPGPLPTPCWIWQRGKAARGRYGQLKINGRTVSAHRAAYQLEYGDLTDEDHVLHKCDVSLCVNPEHLKKGTHLENMQESAARGRHATGENHPMCKLNDEQIEYAICQVKNGRMQIDVAAELGVHSSRISRITRGQRNI